MYFSWFFSFSRLYFSHTFVLFVLSFGCIYNYLLLYVKDAILEEEINNGVIPSAHTSLPPTIVTISNSVFLPSYIVIVLHSFTCVRGRKKHITLFVSLSGFFLSLSQDLSTIKIINPNNFS